MTPPSVCGSLCVGGNAPPPLLPFPHIFQKNRSLHFSWFPQEVDQEKCKLRFFCCVLHSVCLDNPTGEGVSFEPTHSAPPLARPVLTRVTLNKQKGGVVYSDSCHGVWCWGMCSRRFQVFGGGKRRKPFGGQGRRKRKACLSQ